MSSHLCSAPRSVEPWQLTPEVIGSHQPPGDQAGTGILPNERLRGVQHKSLYRLTSRDAGKFAKNAILELNDLNGNYSPRSCFLLETLGQSLKKLAIKIKIKKERKKRQKKCLQAKRFFFNSESFIIMKLVGKVGVILLAL